MTYRIYTVISREALRLTVDNKGEPEVGKIVVQGGHSFLHTFWDAERRFPAMASAYRGSDHAYKVTVLVDTNAELVALYNEYRSQCGVSLVIDSGFTVYDEPTTTCLGIGPITKSDAMAGSLGKLKTFRKWKG